MRNMKITNLHATTAGYKVKNLILNLSGTVLIGEVQDKDSMLEYISTKWNIDRENEKCICQLGNSIYDISLKGKFLRKGADENESAPKKNFYTFNKNAWHCKLYKWIFGKEPHKVHPTMCPYFWIMVVVFLAFPIVLLIKLTGKGGVKFMEACSTYSDRRAKKKRQDKIDKLNRLAKGLNDHQAYDLRKTSLWDDYKWHIPDELRREVDNKADNWYKIKRTKEREADLKKWAKEDADRQLMYAKKEKIEEKKHIREVQYEEFKESKTTKIIGIFLVIVFGGFMLYGIGLTLIALVLWINWKWVVMGIAGLLLALVIIFSIYLLFRYIIIPIFKYGINPIFSWIFEKIGNSATRFFDKLEAMEGPVLPDYKLKKKIRNTTSFIFGWVVPLITIIARGFVYMIDFFQMGIDLIRSMYKKNCPRITWVDEEQNDK
jgi:hypothetical protein